MMDPKIKEQLDRINELTDDELTELNELIVAEFDRVDGEAKSTANVDIMKQLADAYDSVEAEQTSRSSAAAEAEQTAADLRSRLHPASAEGEGEGEGEGEASSGDDDDEDGKPAGLAASAPKPQPRPSAAAFNSQAAGRPVPGASSSGLTAKGRVFAMMHGKSGRRSGEEISDRKELAELMNQQVANLGRGSGERMLVASVQIEYPEERQLTGDPVRDMEKIEAVVSPQAIVASGGICNPVAVDFSLLVQSSDDEPLAAALPSFQANRGGLRYMLPPTFQGVGSSATAVWTEIVDANPGTATKSLQTIACGTENEVFVDAIPTRLKFGNMQSRFFPEMVDANTELALANAARVRELYRLSKISASSTVVSSGQLLGASRDIAATLDQALAAYRYRSRLLRSQTIRAIFPDWAKDMFRADIARTYSADPMNILAVDDSAIDSWFTKRGVNVTWMLDGQAAVTGAPASGLQGFGSQPANNVLLNWPTTLVWWLFAEGTFQRLDAGRMDLGVVRDSLLDGTNDYETFVEVFEGIAFRGYESLQVVSSVRPNGSYAGSVQTATSPSIY